MSKSMFTAGAAVVVAVGLVAGAHAQEAPGGKGTVLKNRAPVAKEVLQVKFPRPQEFTLSNGLRVYILEDHRLPSVDFSLMLRSGGLYETRPGLADLTASMLDEGTKTRPAQQFAREVEEIGASFSAAAQTEYTSVGISGLSEFTPRLVDLMSDALLHPTFAADRVERVKFQTLSSLTQQRANPNFLAGELSQRVLYGNTAYARLSPTPEEVKALTREDLARFHDRFYRPDGAFLGVAGDVDPRKLLDQLEHAFSDWKSAGAEPELPRANFDAKTATKIYLIDRPGSVQTVLRFGNIGITRTDPDYLPLVIANQILGGGFSSRLFQNLREDKGYTYGAYSQLAMPRWRGTWTAGAAVRTPVTEPAVHEFFAEFKRLQEEPVSSGDLERAKRAIVGSFARTLESPKGILDRALELVRYHLPSDYWDAYPERIQSVTSSDVQRVARKYLGEGRIQLIAVGERDKIEPGLAKYGPVEVVTPNGLPKAAGG